MKKIYFITAIMSLLIVGCTSIDKDDNDIKFSKAFKLQHIFHDDVLLKDPQIAVSDSFIILATTYKDEQSSVCYIYSTHNGVKHVCTYGDINSGPKDFRQPVLTFANGNTFGLNDINERTLALLHIEKDKNGKHNVIENYRLKAPLNRSKEEFIPLDTRYIPINNGEFYVSALFMDKDRCFTLSDNLLTPIQRFGESPISEELDGMVIRNRLNGFMATYDNKLFYATMDLPYISSYKLDGDKMVKLWSKFYKTPYYMISNGDVKFDKDKSMGPLKDMCVDSQYIYMLYMNQLLSEYDTYDTEKSASNTIYVFKHDGEPVACLDLDCRLRKLAIDPKQHKLYGIAQLPDYSLVEFKLPEELYK